MLVIAVRAAFAVVLRIVMFYPPGPAGSGVVDASGASPICGAPPIAAGLTSSNVERVPLLLSCVNVTASNCRDRPYMTSIGDVTVTMSPGTHNPPDGGAAAPRCQLSVTTVTQICNISAV